MEGLKVKIVVFNHGEVPTPHSGNKEKSTVMRYLKLVDFTHIAAPEGATLLCDWIWQLGTILMYHTSMKAVLLLLNIYIAEGGQLAVGVALSIEYQGAGLVFFVTLKCTMFQVVAVHLVRDL